MIDKAPPHGRTARLYALIARERRVGVIFRRGPSNRVRLIRWTLGDDRFEPGQWLKARVYPLRCDLSPAGDLLCYFAATFRPPFQTWTAISRPPYFTALALWPKGDAWGGGGLFESGMRLRLNHRSEPYHRKDETALADGFKLPKRFVVEPLWENAGWGEDDPIRFMRLERDGWSYVQAPQGERWNNPGAAIGVVTDAPEILAKPANTRGGTELTLQVACHGRFERGGRGYVGGNRRTRWRGPARARPRRLGRPRPQRRCAVGVGR